MRSKYLSLLLIILLISVSCKKETRPVDVDPAVDICASCKMNITKLNFASEIIMNDGRVFKFDDINCMNTFVNRNRIKKSEVKAIFVRDYETSEWINVDKDKVYFLRSKSKRIFTPMDSGIIIFNNRERAERFAKENDCEFLSFEEIVKFPE